MWSGVFFLSDKLNFNDELKHTLGVNTILGMTAYDIAILFTGVEPDLCEFFDCFK